MPSEFSVLRRWLPARRADANKGQFGHALIVAGSRGMAGAAILSARAACRSGAGLVTLAVPEGLQGVVAGRVPEALTLGLPETPSGALARRAAAVLTAAAARKNWNALAIGPGLGTAPETRRALLEALRRLPLPAVIDADGLNLLSGHSDEELRALLAGRARCVLTPHPGEMARLLGAAAAWVAGHRKQAALRLARLGCVCLLKGRGTVVTDGRRRYLNETGNAGLAKGGTGDVLTGLIAGLWAQRLKADAADSGFEAAALGAWLHGAAGDAAARAKTPSALLASDVVEALPAAFRRLGR